MVALACGFSASAQKKKDYTPYVDPFIGTGGHGHTYPGAVLPFGMVQLSPDTRLEGWDGCSGYHYTDSVVYGFSHTHLSGTGIADYCDILFMPTTGDPQFKNTAYSSPFKKKNETASPGYYKTTLDKYGIDVELTATIRAGMHRYHYPSTPQANIIIDLQHRDQVLNSWIEVINDHEIRGYRESRSWANDQHIYFYAKFSKPFKTYGIAVNDQLQEGLKKAEGKNIKLYIRFNDPGEVISKVGISAVSADGALKNLDAEIPDFNFKKIQKAAKTSWADALAKIEIEGGAPPVQQEQQQSAEAMTYGYGRPPSKKTAVVDYGKIKRTIFYTALYHSMLSPNIYSDIDGRYRGMDQQIHTADGFNYYTVFSLWDTFRAEHPLLTLIDRKRTLDFIKSFLAIYDQQGLLPIWSLASNETYCMIGNHAIPVITDAYAKGIRDFDVMKAFTAMKASVNRDQFGLDSYRKNGLVLADDNQESVSKTLEYAYDDWCIAQMAKMLNKPIDYVEYTQRAQYWKNVQNKDNGFVQARVNGDWYKPFDPNEVNKNYVEGNAWQYSFLAPQDVNGLISRLGGKANFGTKLNELFTTTAPLTGIDQSDITGLIGQYAHGNEPSHHMAYLFNFTDDADKTQFFVNKILTEQYSNKPDGLSGNDDCGQMSAWYVMSALGMYNIAPGQQQFQIGLPQFEKAVINLENGKKFTVLNSGSSVARNNIYLQGINLNKKTYNKLYLDYEDIANGGEFEVYTGRLANKIFMQDLEKSTSGITDNLIVPNPTINLLKTFAPPVQAAINSNDIEVNVIHYTTDGSTPTPLSPVYVKPIPVSVKTIIKAIAVKNGKSSFVTEAHF
nr:GH92 family glycosyl hydrolase [Mucilaginibacter sp. UR6-11]